jgi:hypothetical protein
MDNINYNRDNKTTVFTLVIVLIVNCYDCQPFIEPKVAKDELSLHDHVYIFDIWNIHDIRMIGEVNVGGMSKGLHIQCCNLYLLVQIKLQHLQNLTSFQYY